MKTFLNDIYYIGMGTEIETVDIRVYTPLQFFHHDLAHSHQLNNTLQTRYIFQIEPENMKRIMSNFYFYIKQLNSSVNFALIKAVYVLWHEFYEYEFVNYCFTEQIQKFINYHILYKIENFLDYKNFTKHKLFDEDIKNLFNKIYQCFGIFNNSNELTWLLRSSLGGIVKKDV
jgi:hypothetical protein